jgi:hypothetical protein
MFCLSVFGEWHKYLFVPYADVLAKIVETEEI